MSIGVSYLPPLYPLTIYSPANFSYQSESVSLATTDKRYLLKVGQDTDNAITTFNGASTFTGQVTATNGLTVNGASFFTGLITTTNGLTVHSGASTLKTGLTVTSGDVDIGGQTGRIKIGYYSTGLISIGDGVGATADLQIGNPFFGRIAFINNPIYPITFWTPTVCKASLTCESGFAVNSLGGAGQTFQVGLMGYSPTPSNFNGLVTCLQGLTVNNTVTTLNLGLTVNNALTTINNGLTVYQGLNIPIGNTITFPTVGQASNNTNGATTEFVTRAITNNSVNMAMTNAIQSFTDVNTFSGGLTTTTNITLPITRIVPTVNQLGYQIIGSLATNTALTSGAMFNGASISLPAFGTWLINCYFVLVPLTANSTISNYLAGLSTVSTTAIPYAGNFVSNFTSQTVPVGNYLAFDTTIILTPNVATTCWLNLTATFTTTGTLNAYNGTSIRAVRIA